MNPQDKAFMTVFSSVLAVLVAIAVVIFIVAQLISGVSAPEYDRSEALRAEAARRLEPVGHVVLAGSAAAEAQQTAAAGSGDTGQSGEQVYNSVCAACHNSGVLNAPKLGDAGAWEERYQKGLDQLVDNAINGYNQMPARGGNAALSDAEVRASVVYLLRESGIEVADAGTEQAASAGEAAPADGETQTTADTGAEQGTAEESASGETQAATSAPENGQAATAAEATGD
ncbi:MAG: c-type cytochrome, partial [Candidatus Competibacterales bacterium]|nr:c-type cytochrome [Candidatus Competibacterales bacterium]